MKCVTFRVLHMFGHCCVAGTARAQSTSGSIEWTFSIS